MSNQKIIAPYILSLLLLWGGEQAVTAQLSQGGIPYSFMQDEVSSQSMAAGTREFVIPTFTMPYVNNSQQAEDALDMAENESYEFAVGFDYTIDVKNEGRIDSLNNGLLYRCAIVSPMAYSIHLVFEQFHIPIGAKLFLYDKSGKEILGAFTSNNNKDNFIFAVAPIFSDEIIVEYFEPYFAEFEGIVQVGQVYHGFIDISKNVEDATCEVDINCNEGENWQLEKRAVCKIVFGSSMCSGALINNTNFDGTPYFLTANHCVFSTARANRCVFYFNYENSGCNSGNVGTTQTLSGAELRATSTNTDFTLLELKERPNANYKPYFAGWDRNQTHDFGGVGIHHPHGYPKKISTYHIRPKTTSCRDIYPNNFYLIDAWAETEHGHGVTEPGSSGSPLFNNKHKIIGQLLGGCTGHNEDCEDPSNDYSTYGKFYLSWDEESTTGTKLRDWLDPKNKNYIAIDGLDICQTGTILDMDIHNSYDRDGTVSKYTQSGIESSAILGPSSKVLYMSNTYIKLLPGFYAQKGSEFEAIIVPSRCYTNSPISVTNWETMALYDGCLTYNVANANKYIIDVHTKNGDVIYHHQDTIIGNSVKVWQPQRLDEGVYLVTIAFMNANEIISNSYTLDNLDKPARSISKVTDKEALLNNSIIQQGGLSVDIYPNPTADILHAEVFADSFSPYMFNIYNMAGALITTMEYANATELNIDVRDLPQGEYILQVIMRNKCYSKPFVKQ